MLPLCACVASPPAAPLPPERSRAAAAGSGPGFGSVTVEQEFELARGRPALDRLRSAPVSVVAVMYQGLPRPVTLPDGSVTYAGPAVNGVVREKGRWLGWKTGRPAPVPEAVAARLDAIVGDPGLWLEPELLRGGACTDAGSLQLAIRSDGRKRFSRQDNCYSRGLAAELGRIVLGEALSPPY